ncbi:MAG: hypothetical protein QM767_02715 [Anaeromyxobacter sp.]
MLTDMLLEPLEVASFFLALFSGAAFVGIASTTGGFSMPVLFVAAVSLVVLVAVASARRVNRARTALQARPAVARA